MSSIRNHLKEIALVGAVVIFVIGLALLVYGAAPTGEFDGWIAPAMLGIFFVQLGALSLVGPRGMARRVGNPARSER